MKKLIYLIICAFAAISFGGCDKGTDESTELRLIPSTGSITANGTDKVEFTVTKAGEDLTSKAEIYLIATGESQQKIEGAFFSTKKNGSYTFQARYNEEISASVTIKASGAVAQAEKYYRNICAFKLTGTWCTACPRGARLLDDLVSRVYPDRLIVMAFHGNASGYDEDPMTIPQTNQIFTLMSAVGSYPTIITDLRKESVCAGDSEIVSKTKDAVNKSFAEYPATSGIRIESAVSGTKLNIKIGVTSNTGGSYRVAAYVMENQLIYRQYDSGIWYEKYEHNHTVRQLLSKSIEGDSLGMLDPDVEKVQEYTVDISDAWKLENLQIGAYVIDDSGTINNVAICDANNGTVDYRLNKQ